MARTFSESQVGIQVVPAAPCGYAESRRSCSSSLALIPEVTDSDDRGLSVTSPNGDVCFNSLFVGDFGGDRRLVRTVFAKSGWTLIESCEREDALGILSRMPVHVVVADVSVPGWPWKQVFADLRDRQSRPVMIVTSRTADDQLWAEALNWGVHDVLARPFVREEVERVMASARRHFVTSSPPAHYAAAAASHLF
jgi:response regulator RpfG family c-di-GMP phosphodiesterase